MVVCNLLLSLVIVVIWDVICVFAAVDVSRSFNCVCKNAIWSWIDNTNLLAVSTSPLNDAIFVLILVRMVSIHLLISLQLTLLWPAKTIIYLTFLATPVAIALSTSASVGNLLRYWFLSSPL